jgi:hypothetical protein
MAKHLHQHVTLGFEKWREEDGGWRMEGGGRREEGAHFVFDRGTMSTS